MVNAANIKYFEWDQGNTEKNWVKHDVHYRECEEVFTNVPLLLSLDVAHSQKEKRFFALGHTNQSRFLFVAFTVRKNKIRVISARNMSKKEKRAYEQAKKIKKDSSIQK
jgi:hypothetical protein